MKKIFIHIILVIILFTISSTFCFGKSVENGNKLRAFLDDIEKSTDLQDFVKAGKDFTKEWQILESYPSFRVQGTFVNKITTILNKGHISEVDFTTILSVNKGLGKRATDLANFLEDLDHFTLYQDRDGFGSIISGLKANWFNGAGADGAGNVSDLLV